MKKIRNVELFLSIFVKDYQLVGFDFSKERCKCGVIGCNRVVKKKWTTPFCLELLTNIGVGHFITKNYAMGGCKLIVYCYQLFFRF